MIPPIDRSKLLSLLHQAREDQDPAARTELNSLLRSDPPSRRTMARLLLDEHALTAALQEREITGLLRDHKPAQPHSGFFAKRQASPWRLLASAAAGLAAGLFGATLVYGFSRQPKIHIQTLLHESFEDPKLAMESGFPTKTGVWSGDLKQAESESNFVPATGLRMVILPPVQKRKYSYATRFVDLSSWSGVKHGTTQKIEVSAAFQGLGPGNRYQIRLAAFDGSVGEARAIWLANQVDEQALAHTARTVAASGDSQTWNRITASIDVPGNTRLVLVSLAASSPDSASGKQPAALDDVHIRLISQELSP